ncbi:hypothetical protein [Blastopirellula retiformator]|uniref:hypothetical protein n=1 Tax=Blastopirellula retiformator TaxID=2527970 RepID=UPI001647B0ED|nr:hypothetical protein [Blastopirellula retiformator]
MPIACTSQLSTSAVALSAATSDVEAFAAAFAFSLSITVPAECCQHCHSDDFVHSRFSFVSVMGFDLSLHTTAIIRERSRSLFCREEKGKGLLSSPKWRLELSLTGEERIGSALRHSQFDCEQIERGVKVGRDSA